MLALCAKTEAGWVLVHAPSLSEFLLFRYLKPYDLPAPIIKALALDLPISSMQITRRSRNKNQKPVQLKSTVTKKQEITAISSQTQSKSRHDSSRIYAKQKSISPPSQPIPLYLDRLLAKKLPTSLPCNP